MNQENIEELYLDNVWRPNMSIVGVEGMPPIASAGNVIRPRTAVKISLRVSPAMDVEKAKEILV